MPIDLAAIRARADAATPDWKAKLNSDSAEAPPYILSREGDTYWPFATALWRTHTSDKASEDAMVAQLEADFEFIAAARQDIPALLDENEALRERVKEMQVDITDMKAKQECRPYAIPSTSLLNAVVKLYRHLEAP